MHPRRRGQTQELTRLLLELAAAGILTSVAVGLAYHPRVAGKAFGALARFSKFRIRQALSRLKMQGMIRYDERDLTSPLFVTKKGLMRHNHYRIKTMKKISAPRRWDYLWRVVFFDIKEKRRWVRDALRDRLIDLGFCQLQQSVYVIPYDCTKEIADLSALLYVRNQLILCVTPSLGRLETRVRNYFLKQENTPKNLDE